MELKSEALPRKEYHQAQRLGEGAYGSVVAAYDDEGAHYAMKSDICYFHKYLRIDAL